MFKIKNYVSLALFSSLFITLSMRTIPEETEPVETTESNAPAKETEEEKEAAQRVRNRYHVINICLCFYMKESMILTIASCITLSRIALTPFIIYSFMQGSWNWGFILFILAVLTDLCDGYVARRYHQESRLGQLLDPIADKILLTGVMFTLLLTMHLTGLFSLCVWFLIVKEFVLLIGGSILFLQYRMFIAPSILSRFVSLCEIMLVVVLLSSKVFSLDISTVVYGLVLFNVFISTVLLLWYTKLITQK